ncbi:hypothetical protein JW752_05400 [Candidatus Peregrinibacteria bacterium]|nr:hypothetical protein [Candidatus Peregrinibacteria bacterium]
MSFERYFPGHESLDSKPLDGGEELHIVKFEDHHANPPKEIFQLCCTGDGGGFMIPFPENARHYKLSEIVEMYRAIKTREDVIKTLRQLQGEDRRNSD